MPSEAIKVAIKWVKEEGIGEPTANYHLRDWIFSRQHYWGEPIPMIFCKNCAENHGNNQVPNSNNQTITNNQNLNDQNERIKTYAKENNIDIEVPKKNPGWYPVPEEELPIVLPEVEHYEPTDTGESPLSMMADWVKAKCPVCGGGARRETDTMPNWAGSDWYYLGYLCNLGSSKFQFSNSKQVQNPNDKNLNKSNSFRDSDLEIRDSQNIFTLNEDILKYWMPVDVYIGGDEHNTLHLLYSRFIYQFLYDLGCVPTPEPYSRRMSHGVILGPDNQRMSKSRGNVIVPDQVADKYGVDVARMYLMFMGPFTGTMAWNEKTLMGVKRFLDRFNQFILDVIARNEETKQSKDGDRHSASWRIAMTKEGGKEDIQIKAIINKLIDGVTRDIEEFGYNTAIAKMMEAINQLRITNYELRKDDIKTLIKLIAPLAPYTAEELWSKVREEKDSISVHIADWPVAEKAMLVEEEITIPVAVNGKVRDQLSINQLRITNGKEIIEEAKGLEKIKQWLVGKQVVKEIYVPGKMINLVVR
ncbi:MAG: class I tRNA ligase family protein [Candidatus Shapirobacteria bacterium]